MTLGTDKKTYNPIKRYIYFVNQALMHEEEIVGVLSLIFFIIVPGVALVFLLGYLISLAPALTLPILIGAGVIFVYGYLFTKLR